MPPPTATSRCRGPQHDYPYRIARDDTGIYNAARVDSPDFPGLPAAP